MASLTSLQDLKKELDPVTITGRNGKEQALERACKRMTAEALHVLHRCLKDEGVDIRWKIVAAKEILDRGWGRPKQSVDANVKVEGSESLIDAINRGKARVIDNTTGALVRPS